METSSLRVAFMGTPDFAAAALAAIAARHRVVGVLSQPPRPKGRGLRLQPSPVQALAESLGIPVFCPETLKDAEAQSRFAALRADVAVVAAYGLILPPAVLSAPRLGCLNIHASLLPRWRGAAPIARAIMAGDGESGITIMRMDAGLDTGPMLLRESLPIAAADTAGSLHDALAALGAKLALQALDRLAGGESLPETPQPAEGATYAKKIDKAEARIDWTRGADEVWRQVRGLSPFPGAWCKYRGERLKVLAAEPADGAGEPGTAIDANLAIACGRGAIRLIRLQRAGGGITGAAEFLRGHPLPPGTRLT